MTRSLLPAPLRAANCDLQGNAAGSLQAGAEAPQKATTQYDQGSFGESGVRSNRHLPWPRCACSQVSRPKATPDARSWPRSGLSLLRAGTCPQEITWKLAIQYD